MQFKQSERFGKVTVEVFRSSYRLRWSHGKRYTLTVGRVSKESLAVARQKASEINLDLMTGHFDPKLVKYDPKRAAITTVSDKPQETLLTLWESYKKIAKNRVAETTQRDTWKQTDRCLSKIKGKSLELCNASDFLVELLNYYSAGTLKRVLNDVNAAVNFAVEQGLIERNPYRKLKQFLPSVSSDGGENDRTQECFTRDEIRIIWEAFKNNLYCSKKDSYKHSYYLPLVQMLSLTGMRPGEAVALTWDDVVKKDNGVWLKIAKSYNNGILKDTKTGESRLFPVNQQLSEIIETFPRIENEHNLIFPSVEKGYINQRNFLKRQWRPIVLRLWNEGKISKYLPTYNLRHSFITKLIQEGLDIATIARVCGTSSEMILKHYLAPKDRFEIPEI